MEIEITAQNCSEIIDTYTQRENHFDLCYEPSKSKGSYLFDSKRNEYFLDAVGFIASSAVSFNHPMLCDEQFEKKILSHIRHKPNNSEFHTVEYASFVKTFHDKLMYPDFKKVFFIDGGSAAVDSAIRFAFDYRSSRLYSSNFINRDGRIRPAAIHFPDFTQEYTVLHLGDAYHGRTGYALSCTNTHKTEQFSRLPIFNKWPRMYYREPITDDLYKRIEDVLYERNVCAVIVEPIQSVAGHTILNKKFIQTLRSVCDKTNVLLIFDEVQTGFYASGYKWCYQHYDIIPDIVVFGKKTQVAGFMVNEKCLISGNSFDTISRLGSTFGGNLVDMIRAERLLEIVESENLLENVKRTSSLILLKLLLLEFKQKLLKDDDDVPNSISNIRGVGTLIAFDFKTEELRDKFLRLCFDHRLLLLGSGKYSIRLRPNLCFNSEDVEQLISIISKCLKILNDNI